MNPFWIDVLGGDQYEDYRWLTYKQGKANGSTLKDGEYHKSITLLKPLILERKKNEGELEEEVIKFPIFRYYKVFNVEQWEGLNVEPLSKPNATEFVPIEEAEKILNGIPNKPVTLHNGGDRAYYRMKEDTIHLPDRSTFDSPNEYYSTRFHEEGHSTGHESRVGREGIQNFDHFGSGQYAKEELVAEFVSAILCRQSGIDNTRENSEAYLRSWIGKLRNDEKLLVSASSQAHKATSYILGGE
jgi:antirestriction protein ArdC